VPTALVTSREVWDKWLAGPDGAALAQAGIRFQGRYYLFQRGKWKNLVVVGNW
jgi:hypothetical protein